LQTGFLPKTGHLFLTLYLVQVAQGHPPSAFQAGQTVGAITIARGASHGVRHLLRAKRYETLLRVGKMPLTLSKAKYIAMTNPASMIAWATAEFAILQGGFTAYEMYADHQVKEAMLTQAAQSYLAFQRASFTEQVQEPRIYPNKRDEWREAYPPFAQAMYAYSSFEKQKLESQGEFQIQELHQKATGGWMKGPMRKSQVSQQEQTIRAETNRAIRALQHQEELQAVSPTTTIPLMVASSNPNDRACLDPEDCLQETMEAIQRLAPNSVQAISATNLFNETALHSMGERWEPPSIYRGGVQRAASRL
jgi:hypothetical protein